MLNKPTATHLGQYLRLLRERRGFENIREYVRKYQLPFSYVYYTEIEAGKRRIGLEASGALCEALEADVPSYYYYLLKDILPAEVQDDFLRLIPIDDILDEQEMARTAERVKDAYRVTLLSRVNLDAGQMTEEAESYFFENHHLVPLVAAIYCVASTTDLELKRVAEQIGITTPIETIVSDFERLGIITSAPSKVKGQRIISRRYEFIYILDQRIMANRVNAETKLTLSECESASPGNSDSPVCFNGMVGLTKSMQEQLIARLADLRAEFNAYHISELNETNSQQACPALLTTLFSRARDYTLPNQDAASN